MQYQNIQTTNVDHLIVVLGFRQWQRNQSSLLDRESMLEKISAFKSVASLIH